MSGGSSGGTVAGGDRLAKELGIGRRTAEGALRQREKEGLLVGLGPRRRRVIGLPGGLTTDPWRVAILRVEASEPTVPIIVEIRHLLTEGAKCIASGGAVGWLDERGTMLETNDVSIVLNAVGWARLRPYDPTGWDAEPEPTPQDLARDAIRATAKAHGAVMKRSVSSGDGTLFEIRWDLSECGQ